MSPTLTSAPAWGTQKLHLTLPGLPLQVADISARQAHSLRRDYERFCAEPQQPDSAFIQLRARQLADFVPPDMAQLTRDGQYAPIKRYPDVGAAFELTGQDFHALLAPAGAGTASLLGVAAEDDLPRATVFENVLRVLSAHSALAAGGAILHSAGIIHRGRAYIFCGRSNAGKTTLSRKAHSAGMEILSDDINLLLPTDSGYAAHAVPFTGEFGRELASPPRQAHYRVAALVLLEQGVELAVELVSAALALSALLVGCPFVNTDERMAERLLDNVSGLSTSLPVLRLRNALGDDIGAMMSAIEQLEAAI